MIGKIGSTDRRSQVPSNPELPSEEVLTLAQKPTLKKTKKRVIHSIENHINTLFLGAVDNLSQDSKDFFNKFNGLTPAQLATDNVQNYLIYQCRKNPDIAPDDVTLRGVLSPYLYMPIDEVNALKRMRELVAQRLRKAYLLAKDQNGRGKMIVPNQWAGTHVSQAIQDILQDKTLDQNDRRMANQVYGIIKKYNSKSVNTWLLVNGIIKSLMSANPENYDYYIKLKYEELAWHLIRDGWKQIHRTGTFQNPVNPKNIITHTKGTKPIGDILLPNEKGYKQQIDKQQNPEKYEVKVQQGNLFANSTVQTPAQPKDTRKPRERNPEQREFQEDEDGVGRPAGRRVRKKEHRINNS